MPEPEPAPDARSAEPAAAGELIERLRATPGLAPLVAEAVATWRARADDDVEPGWRAFSDAFPTFYEFTNRPR
jgi:hypothetical protein